jgi:sugar phosphate isomerase/epimerase
MRGILWHPGKARSTLYTRRELGKLALAAVPGAAFLQKPTSRIAGVQIGLNVPYSFGSNTLSGEETLQRCVQLGVSGVELRSQPVEAFLGVPADLVKAASGRGRNPTPDQAAARKAALDGLRKWRLAAPVGKVKEFRKKYEDAGVQIEIVKFDAIYAREDAELDYCFEIAKALGARAISCEISVPDTKRLGQFADKHRLMVGYHGHASTGPADWETAFGYAKYNGANVDIGHFVAGHNTSPVPFLKQHHARITHIHVKDRKMNNGANTPFGQGDTPIEEVLQLIRDNKWPIQATIEFEYPVPEGSDRMAEIAKCVQFCKDALR